MRYGFYLPTRGQIGTPESIATLVQRAEQVGFSSTMIGDHIVFPVTIRSAYPFTASGAFPGGGDTLESLTLMSFVAAKTTTLRLVTSVIILPLRNPVVTAKILATIDVLSGGRLTVGVGVGWLREEFEALGAPDFERRGAVSDEYLRIFKLLWTESPASFSGQFYRFEALHSRPLPVQKPHPPIWVGGSSKAALRRAARFGDGWHPVGAIPTSPLRPDELRATRDELYRLIEAEGRDPKALTICYKVPDNDPAIQSFFAQSGERQPFSGSPEQIMDDVATYARLGVSELIFDIRRQSLAESLDRMESFGALIRQTAAL